MVFSYKRNCMIFRLGATNIHKSWLALNPLAPWATLAMCPCASSAKDEQRFTATVRQYFHNSTVRAISYPQIRMTLLYLVGRQSIGYSLVPSKGRYGFTPRIGLRQNLTCPMGKAQGQVRLLSRDNLRSNPYLPELGTIEKHSILG